MAEPLAQLRLLIVDDNKQMRTIIGTVLSAVGVGHLHFAEHGREALRVIEAFPIDVAYVDHEMPVMNGLDFLSAVRAMESGDRFLPIIMVTGHSDRPRLEAARDRGVTEFLRKPVMARDILSRLEAVILRPRPFVISDSYFGPDRRRRRDPAYRGPLRRAEELKTAVEL